MKKIKKLLAMIMAMTMVLGLGLTSFAAIGGASIHVSGLSTNGTQTVTIYEIFSLNENNDEWVAADWVPEDVTPENLGDHISDLVSVENKTVAGTTTSTSGIADFSDLQAGAYLVIASDGANKVTYNPMIAVTYEYDKDTELLVAKKATVIAKASEYTTDKTEDVEDDIVAVGDIITYQITTTVPFVDETAEEPLNEFWIGDTISGADYYFGDGITGGVWNVLVGDEDLTESHPAAITENSFSVDLSDLLEDNVYAGQQVVITYTVKVNAVDEVTNTALSSNDPDAGTGTGKTETYTGSMKITKYGEDPDGEAGEETAPVLSGAQFVVYRENNGKREYATIDENGYITGTWTEKDAIVTSGDQKWYDVIGTVTTDAQGVAVVKGLDVGTYYFEEVVAPDGYRINETPSNCEVDLVKGDLEHPDKITGAFGETTMADTKLASLPSTGGIGTTIFTIGGCAIMIAAAALYFVNRRKSEEN